MLTRLVRDVEVVQERMVLDDGALRDGRDTVSPIGPVLEQTVPMLRDAKTDIRVSSIRSERGVVSVLTILVAVSIVSFCSLSMTLIRKLSP